MPGYGNVDRLLPTRELGAVMTSAETLFDKLWKNHVVMEHPLAGTLLYIDRHYLTEGSRNGFSFLQRKGLQVRRPDLSTAVADHYVPSTSRDIHKVEVKSRRDMIADLSNNAAASGIEVFGLDHPDQGIVHVMGPEKGLSLPGLSIICGDSHTASHGAMGALAFGVGASQVAHALATQTIWQKKPKQMRILVDGVLPPDVTAKDLILHIIALIGASGGTGYAVEYAGSAVEALSVEGRLTLCNMTIEAGARFGLVAPDALTFDYIRRRRPDISEARWQQALGAWRVLHTDASAVFDREVHIDAAHLQPMITWGTSPEDAIPVGGLVPELSVFADPALRGSKQEALAYMGLQSGERIGSVRFDRVFIGSCTNSRLEDLRLAASTIRGRKTVLPAIVVPGSMSVKRAAEAEGLDAIFRDAGFEWRLPGCSMCVGMNGDLAQPGERCASTSNRNFVGRQGARVRTHLVNPALAVEIAVNGHPTTQRVDKP